MISPRVSEINGQQVREQTLDEYLSANLDPEHCARQQLGELREALKVSMESAQNFEEQKLDLLRKVDDLNSKLTKANGELKMLYEKVKLHDDHAKRSAAGKAQAIKNKEKREALSRPAGDAGDQL